MDDDTDLVPALRRWEDAGGVWRVAARSATAVTVSLCRCDGGEEVERLRSTHPDTLAFVAGLLDGSSSDGAPPSPASQRGPVAEPED